MTEQTMSQPMTETTPFIRRPWFIGGLVLLVIIIATSCFFFMLAQYRSSVSAYAWVQKANEGQADQSDDMICEDSQALYFGQAFHKRYGKEVSINLSQFEQDDDKVTFEGEIDVAGKKSDYKAVFYIHGDGHGFLGRLGCVERIEQLEPHPLPGDFFGG